MAIRIQRKRTKGCKQPEGTVYVGRPSKWGNPFTVGKDGLTTIEKVLSAYELATKVKIGQGWLDINELKGKNLSCWCSLSQKCHADILLKLANK
jgi:hypothetical protein